jgi:hypothetical protein
MRPSRQRHQPLAVAAVAEEPLRPRPHDLFDKRAAPTHAAIVLAPCLDASFCAQTAITSAIYVSHSQIDFNTTKWSSYRLAGWWARASHNIGSSRQGGFQRPDGPTHISVECH